MAQISIHIIRFILRDSPPEILPKKYKKSDGKHTKTTEQNDGEI